SIDQIQQGKILGQGESGRVYFCSIKGARYAAKFFETGKTEARELFQREVEILRKMNFINIITLAYFIPENLVIITPYYDMDLWRIVEEQKSHLLQDQTFSWISDND